MKWAVVLLFTVLPLSAQAPRGFYTWWENRGLVRDLNISAEQERQIRQTVREHRLKIAELRVVLEKAENEVEDAFNEDLTDTRAAQESVERLITARGDITRVLTQMSLRLRSVLTTEQWRELQRRRPQMGPPGMRQGPGPRGPMRRGPNPATKN